ncbi:single-stranded-DNA-specific exonuclease RecJ [Breznakiellaceae bacterium SP9]
MKVIKKDIPPESVKDVASKYGCDFLTASILLRRGIRTGEEIKYFLEDDPRHLHNPFLLPGMEDAVERILAAREEGEKIMVFGDRDVDGITATTLVTSFLRSLDIDIRYRIPTGDEPYGLSIAAVEAFAADYGTLIITVDCGISNVKEIKRANELSVDVIVTDHHNPHDEVPDAFTIVNPKLNGSKYPFTQLCGCGVAYKLVSALRFALRGGFYAQPICLLNTRPLNDAFIIEIAKIRNLAVLDTLTETIIPGMVSIEATRLPQFLSGQQILVWDLALQKRTLAKIFGKGVEIGMLDIAAQIGKEIPAAAGKTLLRIKELSRIARYSPRDFSELDVFVSLFQSYVALYEKSFNEAEAADLQLAALGTLADIMPLRDENRIIVRQGLASMIKSARPGLKELLFRLELSGRPLRNSELSWQVCPTINAAGRMGTPEKALELFLAGDPVLQNTLAQEVITLNTERKKRMEENWLSAEPLAHENLPTFNNTLAVAYGEKIYRGVTGLIANRLADLFKKPALVATFANDTVTGSLRSPHAMDYSILPLLSANADLLTEWGGHDFAAGFSLDKANWTAFLENIRVQSYSIELPCAQDALFIDAELPFSYLTPDIMKTVEQFEPYGEGNETLLFLTKAIKIADIKLMGSSSQHVKLTLDTGTLKWSALYWNAGDKVKRDFDKDDTVDVVYKLSWNWFNGTETPQLVVSDLRRSLIRGTC